MNYQELVDRFTWEEAERYFNRERNGKVNMAQLVCDRWADDPERIAIYWEDAAGNKQTWTYRQLKEKSDQMANALKSLGITKGDRVAGLLPKDMELIITVIATWKIGAIYVPLFTAFGPDAIMHRITESGVHLLLTIKSKLISWQDKIHLVKCCSLMMLRVMGKRFGNSLIRFRWNMKWLKPREMTRASFNLLPERPGCQREPFFPIMESSIFILI